MSIESIVEAFGRGLAQGMVGQAQSAPQRRPREKRNDAPPAAGRTIQPELPLEPDFTAGNGVQGFEPGVAIPPTVKPPFTEEEMRRMVANGEVTQDDLAEIDAILTGRQSARKGSYIPEDTEGDQPWKAS